jgi:PAS domain S-box-containing protein
MHFHKAMVKWMCSTMTEFENLLEAVPDALVGMDQQGVIRFVNRQTESLFGYDRDQLVGQPIQTLVPESLWQIYAEHQQNYFADPRTRSSGLDVELSGRRHDDTQFPINVSLSHIDTGDVLLVITAVRDVTTQQQAVKNAQLIAAIVQGSEDAIISGSLSGAITSWNPAAERMYGYTSAEIIGKPAKLLTPKDRAGEVQAVLGQIKAGRRVERLESKRVRKDGTVFPVLLTVSPIRDENGKIFGTSVIHRDLTDQKEALAVAQRMTAIVEYSDDAIMGGTLDGIITSWNPAAARMFGYSSQEIVGKHIGLIIPQDQAGEMISILAKISAGRPVDNFETIRVRKDGTVFPVSLTISPIRDDNGAVVAASVICRDITELKHAALYARSLLEAALDPLVTISPEGKITDVNEATVKATGVLRNKLIGTPFSDYFTDPDKAEEIYQRVITKGKAVNYPLTMRHRDGTLTRVLYNASLYRDTGGNILGLFAAARDMTTQKEASEAVQRMAAIVEHSGDAIIGLTAEGIITSWNPAAERMLGYPSQEIVRRSVDLLSFKDRAPEMVSILARISAGQALDNCATVFARQDGTVLPVMLTVAPIRDADDAVVGASAIARDMSASADDLT